MLLVSFDLTESVSGTYTEEADLELMDVIVAMFLVLGLDLTGEDEETSDFAVEDGSLDVRAGGFLDSDSIRT